MKIIKLLKQALCKHEYEKQWRVIKGNPLIPPYYEYHYHVYVCKKCGKEKKNG